MQFFLSLKLKELQSFVYMHYNKGIGKKSNSLKYVIMQQDEHKLLVFLRKERNYDKQLLLAHFQPFHFLIRTYFSTRFLCVFKIVYSNTPIRSGYVQSLAKRARYLGVPTIFMGNGILVYRLCAINYTHEPAKRYRTVVALYSTLNSIHYSRYKIAS